VNVPGPHEVLELGGGEGERRNEPQAKSGQRHARPPALGPDGTRHDRGQHPLQGHADAHEEEVPPVEELVLREIEQTRDEQSMAAVEPGEKGKRALAAIELRQQGNDVPEVAHGTDEVVFADEEQRGNDDEASREQAHDREQTRHAADKTLSRRRFPHGSFVIPPQSRRPSGGCGQPR